MTTQISGQTEQPIGAVELKDPVLSAFLAWLIPGLGHAYQGRWAKAVLFFVCIMGTFVYGLYLGSGKDVGWGRVVYAAWRPEKRLYYLCQVGVGLPAMPALIQAIRVQSGKEPFGTFMAPPRWDKPENAPKNWVTLDMVHRRLARYFELGTIYTAVAGLLNVLVILDAWAGPVMPAPSDKKDDEEKDGESTDDR